MEAKITGKRIEVETDFGTLIAMPASDENYPGIFLDFVPKNAEQSIPVALLELTPNTEFKGQKSTVRLLIWEDPQQEDYTDEVIYFKEELK